MGRECLVAAPANSYSSSLGEHLAALHPNALTWGEKVAKRLLSDCFRCWAKGRTLTEAATSCYPLVTADGGLESSNLSAEAFDLFRQRAAKSRRVDEPALHDGNEALLDKLSLVDGDYLERAAVLLFHPAPEKFSTAAYVKIGFFASDDDLRCQDEVHGLLLLQVECTLDLLQTKYTKAQVRYEGASRLEESPFPAACSVIPII